MPKVNVELRLGHSRTREIVNLIQHEHIKHSSSPMLGSSDHGKIRTPVTWYAPQISSSIQIHLPFGNRRGLQDVCKNEVVYFI